MPEVDSIKIVPHPGKRPPEVPASRARAELPYAEIQVTTNFTFLTGASHPEEYADRAAALGYRGLAVTDTNSLAGVVRMHVAAKQAGMPLAVGCRLLLETEAQRLRQAVLVYPTDRASYGNLCQLLTRGRLRGAKGECHLSVHDLLDYESGLLAVLVPPREVDQHFLETAAGLKRVFTPRRLSIALARPFSHDDERRMQCLAALGRHLSLPLAATNDVRHHAPQRKPLLDVVTCIREGVTLDEAGYRLAPNAESHLKSPEEMHRLFADYPEAIARSVAIVEQASAFSLDELRYEYPHETCPDGVTPMQRLTELTWAGAKSRYADLAEPGCPDPVPDKVKYLISHELELIEELNYPHYFLTVHDIVAFARSRGIICQGRGAAGNSAVCFALGITEVDPNRIAMLFERFVSKERDEPPDIDIDFEHERREEVIQYIYAKYGRHRAALTAEVITYRNRSAIREVGKVLGLSLDFVDRLAKNHDWFNKSSIQPEHLRKLGFNPDDPTLKKLCILVRQILGFPRHLSQHVGGFVLTERPLSETVPIENAAMPDRTVIEWDKDDIEALGMLKVDVLGLGMLTCVRKSFELIAQHEGPKLAMYTVPPEDPEVYDMVCRADTVGVFQIESRAQMSMLPRLRPREFYDLVIEVAIVRPGPIQGGMVHPYLRRRAGEEAIDYPSEKVKAVLERTLGVPLFQEQAMALAIEAAGFTPGEADQLRRSMAAWKRKGNQLQYFGERLIAGMRANGYTQEFAERCFEQIKGFSEYGFPESHAAAFALIVYVSAWLKHHHPAAFAAALINSQPMGFYAPAQIARDAAEHGVEVRPIDVNHSRWDCTLEKNGVGNDLALRLGMRITKGLGHDDAELIASAMESRGRFDDVESLWRSSGASVKALRRLAAADAFGSMGLDRQQALWQIRKLRDERLPLFESVETPKESRAPLPLMNASHQVLHDYLSTGLSLKAHPLSFMRERLDELNVTPNHQLEDKTLCPNGRPVAVAGIVLVRQRPGTAFGITFMTLEDEGGVANLIVRPKIFEQHRAAARHGLIVLARGTIERDSTTGDVVHVLVKSVEDIGRPDSAFQHRARNFH